MALSKVSGVEEVAGTSKDLAPQRSIELKSPAVKLSTHAMRAGPWTEHQNLALARIVRKGEMCHGGGSDGTKLGGTCCSLNSFSEQWTRDAARVR